MLIFVHFIFSVHEGRRVREQGEQKLKNCILSVMHFYKSLLFISAVQYQIGNLMLQYAILFFLCFSASISQSNLCPNQSLDPQQFCDLPSGQLYPGSTCAGTICDTLEYRGLKITKTCGNGIVENDQRCDLGFEANLNVEGCWFCLPAPGYSCAGNVCKPACGNGVIQTYEECQASYLCSIKVSQQCDDGNKINEDICSNKCMKTFCGDGIVNHGEECDPANKGLLTTINTCNLQCKLISNIFIFSSLDETPLNDPKLHLPICGNKIIEYPEECDTGRLPGCLLCVKEPGYECNSVGTLCNRIAYCGNGIREEDEQCDNNNQLGCSQDCKIDEGYDCIENTHRYSFCRETEKISLCGNKKVDAQQQCDNGNKVGCINCQVERGYICSKPNIGQQSVCKQSFCGNGIKEGIEQCDNFNRPGCRNCKQQSFYQCQEDKNLLSTCQKISICGNGVRQGQQQCDNYNTAGCALCLRQPGYICIQNQQTRLSNCQKVIKGHCGNKIQELGEECDNGGVQGCKTCVIETGYSCLGHFGVQTICGKTVACGNALLQQSNLEECDDGNSYSGDGCNFNCAIQVGWACILSVRQQSLCQRTRREIIPCGNGILEEAFLQECDDGDNLPDNGCSPECQIQDGWKCSQKEGSRRSICVPVVKVDTCGNGFIESQNFQNCDDSNRQNNDGCSSECRIQSGYICTEPIINILSYCFKTCGNGYYEPKNNELCDDANTRNGDGCSQTCQIEPNFECPYNTEGQQSICIKSAFSIKSPQQFCGNKKIQLGEFCDDGNRQNHDGCNQLCEIERGWNCGTNLPSACSINENIQCGNGVVQKGEECDDENGSSGDGCSANCFVERDWICSNVSSFVKSICIKNNICGNGKLEVFAGQKCDDGNDANGDGCAQCQIQNGWACILNVLGLRSICVEKNCGDGKFDQALEECDDGNVKSGDGCNYECEIEQKWSCIGMPGTRSKCQVQCGNGIFQPEFYEFCDDGNNIFGDGCDKCIIEASFKCLNSIYQTSTCFNYKISPQFQLKNCGNGAFEPYFGEECDDGDQKEGDGCQNCRIISPGKCFNYVGLPSICYFPKICFYDFKIPLINISEKAHQLLKQTRFAGVRTVKEIVYGVIEWTGSANIIKEDYFRIVKESLGSQITEQLRVISQQITACTGISL